MLRGKRKTIGAFICKAYELFDDEVCRALQEDAAKYDADIILFSTVGYYASRNDYDAQERKMFSFAPLEELDGILIAPDTYELEGFREELLREVKNRARCPVAAIRHDSEELTCTYTEDQESIL